MHLCFMGLAAGQLLHVHWAALGTELSTAQRPSVPRAGSTPRFVPAVTPVPLWTEGHGVEGSTEVMSLCCFQPISEVFSVIQLQFLSCSSLKAFLQTVRPARSASVLCFFSIDRILRIKKGRVHRAGTAQQQKVPLGRRATKCLRRNQEQSLVPYFVPLDVSVLSSVNK